MMLDIFYVLIFYPVLYDSLKCPFMSSVHILIELLLFFIVEFRYVLDLSPLSDTWFANTFLPLWSLSFYLLSNILCRAGF